MTQVIWRGSPNYYLGPSGYTTLAIVSHRIVGTLAGADGRFQNAAEKASSHFGIGYINGALTIWQWVDLFDSAWTNGDVYNPTWPLYIPNSDPNRYTVTIEHEDGGYAKYGVVTEEIWQASMELQTLLVSGDIAAIRAAGIHMRDDSVAAELAAIPKDETGFIDHNQIAGSHKPYCFRRWLNDPGFVEGSPSRRDRLLEAVRGGIDMAPLILVPEQPERTGTVYYATGWQYESFLPTANPDPATWTDRRVWTATAATNAPIRGPFAVAPGLLRYYITAGTDQGRFLGSRGSPSIFLDPLPTAGFAQADIDAAVATAVGPLTVQVTVLSQKITNARNALL